MLQSNTIAIIYREVPCADYRCAACKRRITDGMGTVAVVDGEVVDGLCCSENCAERHALLPAPAPVAAQGE